MRSTVVHELLLLQTFPIYVVSTAFVSPAIQEAEFTSEPVSKALVKRTGK